MKPDAEKPSQNAIERAAQLRQITIPDINTYLDHHWNDVSVEIANPNEHIMLPADWHGITKYGRPFTGDALVLFGPNLTDPIEGTHLPADQFIDGLRTLGFQYENGKEEVLTDRQAIDILTSNAVCENVSLEIEKPVLRAVHGDRPILIEIRNGSLAPVMRDLSRGGNDPDMDERKKLDYRNALDTCLGAFSAMGASAVRQRLRLGHVPRDTFMDDCCATASTALGLWLLDDEMRGQRRTLKELRVGVASTQAISIAVWYAFHMNESLLIRTGGLFYGLGNKDMGSNYLINTLREPLESGYLYGVGDMGNRLQTGREQFVHPEMRIHIPWLNGNRNSTTVCLSGGYAMLELLEERTAARQKYPDAVIRVLQAARVNPPPESDGKIHNWGVLFRGMHLPLFEHLASFR